MNFFVLINILTFSQYHHDNTNRLTQYHNRGTDWEYQNNYYIVGMFYLSRLIPLFQRHIDFIIIEHPLPKPGRFYVQAQ